VKHSTGKPTKAEQERLDAIHAMPCLACEFEKNMLPQPSRTEAHHLVDKGYRSHSGGHMATIPLCGWHHRGETAGTLYKREMQTLYGPSLEHTKRAFTASYGSERELLAITNARLEKAEAA
jgi:hypothetical protein